MSHLTRKCPLCGWTGSQFLPMIHAHVNHYDSRCPQCRSVERHRLAFMLMKDRIPPGKKILHFAPEKSIQPWLKSVADVYISADIDSAKASVKADITNMTFENNSFDVIWCSHVLEHVDDSKAISEIFRVLTPGGFAVIQIPTWGKKTQEDKTITDSKIRERLYFQGDHIRRYGIDVIKKFESTGFKVEVLRDQDIEPEVVYHHALSFSMTNEVFICRK